MSAGTGIAIGVGVVAVVGLVGYLFHESQKNKPTSSQVIGGAFIDLAKKIF